MGEHFEWRVPIDDENTLSVTWKYTRVPKEMEPYEQKIIPTWYGPVFDEMQNYSNKKPLKALISDASLNHQIKLPMVYGHLVTQSRTIEEIKNQKTLYPFYKSYVFQAGQPNWVAKMSSQALGIEVQDFDGIVVPRHSKK